MTNEPQNIVDQLLNEVDAPRKRNVIADNKPLADAIKYFLELKRTGDEKVKHLSLAWFYRTKLRDRFDGPKTLDTVRTFVREILKVDLDGNPL